jgi:CheY-like chemotaxis protein
VPFWPPELALSWAIRADDNGFQQDWRAVEVWRSACISKCPMRRLGWSCGLLASITVGPVLFATVKLVAVLRTLPVWLAHRRARVLLVAEFAPYAALLSRTLRGSGYRVESCHPRAALDAVATGKYGVVVSGLAIPGLTCVELLAAVTGSSTRTRVIFLTSDLAGELAARALRAGALVVLDMRAMESLGPWVSEAFARGLAPRPAQRPIALIPSARTRAA